MERMYATEHIIAGLHQIMCRQSINLMHGNEKKIFLYCILIEKYLKH